MQRNLFKVTAKSQIELIQTTVAEVSGLRSTKFGFDLLVAAEAGDLRYG